MTQKKKRAIKKLLDILNGDNLNVEESDESVRGKGAEGDIVLQFKSRKYPINVARKENLPTVTLEKEKEDQDILMLRKNRESWKVYMDLNTLINLLLNNRS
jgi:hypothetical protein